MAKYMHEEWKSILNKKQTVSFFWSEQQNKNYRWPPNFTGWR